MIDQQEEEIAERISRSEWLERKPEHHEAVAPRRIVVRELLEFPGDMPHPAGFAVELVRVIRIALRINDEHRLRVMCEIGRHRPEMAADLDHMRAVAQEMGSQHLTDGCR